LVALLGVALSVPQAAIAKGPCGKMGSRCRLIQEVRVVDVTSDSAVVEARVNAEASYEIELGHKVAATGTVAGTAGHEIVTLTLAELKADRSYGVVVKATSVTEKETSKRISFRTK
jgi:hypothetical protein